MTFSEILARERKARSLSQEALADRVQVSRQAVSKWETGDATPDFPKLLALADALDMSLDALCGRAMGKEAAPRAKTPDIAAAPSGKPAPGHLRFWRALCALLALCLLGGALLVLRYGGVPPAENAPAGSALPEMFTVSGVEFRAPGGGMLDFRFVPSAAKAGVSYQMTFMDGEAQTVTADAAIQGGVCTGSVFLPAVSRTNPCTVVVTAISQDGSRGIAVADGLWFEDGSASWTPAQT